MLTLSVLGASGATQELNEYQLKAAYLYKFLAFTEWPSESFASSDTPFGLCVLGNDPFGPILDALGEMGELDGRSISVSRLQANDELTDCHMLFIARSEEEQLEDLLAEGNLPRGCLTVSDIAGFVDDGGGIELTRNGDGGISFRVNLSVTRRAGLDIRSKMLRLASEVLDDEETHSGN